MRSVACLAIFILIILAGPSFAGKTITINTSIKPPFSTVEKDGFFDLLVKEMGRRMGVDVELVRLPPERALVAVNRGESSGEMPRIAGLEDRYDNIVRVGEKLIDYEFVAFSRDPSSVRKWSDLRGKRVGYLIGWKIFEMNVPRGPRITRLSKPDLLFDMLEVGRIEVALYEKYAGWHIIKQHGHGVIQQCEPPLSVKPMYLYFNKREEALVPQAVEALRSMKRDGTYQRIANETLEK